MKVAILYGSTTGKTRSVAQRLSELLAGSQLLDVAEVDARALQEFDAVALGVSTWGTGALQDDWSRGLDELRPSALEGKALAFFGLGDRVTFPDTFCAAVGELRGRYAPAARSVFEPDLLIDDDNEPQRTLTLVEQWATGLKAEGWVDR